jgi:glycosyltransferase involved in cell wall biosynthesis
MRIAQVAPLYESVPPQLYGGTERVVSWLTEELVGLGHEVTLFAAGNSITKARLIPACPESLRLNEACIDQLAHHLIMLEQVLVRRDEFDFIHFHVDYLHFSMSRAAQWAQVTTLHGRLDIPDLPPMYRTFPEMPVISISDAQRRPLPRLNWQGTVHHGLPRDSFRLHAGSGNYLAFLGRTSPEKGLDRAVEIAIATDMPLKIAAKIDRADREYFEAVIRPLLAHPLVEFVGEIGVAQQNDFLGNAAALLFPVQWPEPFGLVMIEAMACGTPIIAFPSGSVPEVVKTGINGFVVADVREAAEAVKQIGTISRKKCRQHFESHFTSARMARDYLEIYQRTVAGKSLPFSVPDGVLSWTKSASLSSTT